MNVKLALAKGEPSTLDPMATFAVVDAGIVDSGQQSQHDRTVPTFTYHRIACSVEKARPATNGLVVPTLLYSRSGDTVTQQSINFADRDQDL